MASPWRVHRCPPSWGTTPLNASESRAWVSDGQTTELNVTVTTPLDVQDVIAGLRDKAKQGNAQAAGALLAYLNRFPVQQSGGPDKRDSGAEEVLAPPVAHAPGRRPGDADP